MEVDRKDDNGNIIYGPDGKPEKERVELDRPRVYNFSVFHASQLETEEREPIPAYEPPPLEWNPHDKAEAILNSAGAAIFHDQQDTPGPSGTAKPSSGKPRSALT